MGLWLATSRMLTMLIQHHKKHDQPTRMTNMQQRMGFGTVSKLDTRTFTWVCKMQLSRFWIAKHRDLGNKHVGVSQDQRANTMRLPTGVLQCRHWWLSFRFRNWENGSTAFNIQWIFIEHVWSYINVYNHIYQPFSGIIIVKCSGTVRQNPTKKCPAYPGILES